MSIFKWRQFLARYRKFTMKWHERTARNKWLRMERRRLKNEKVFDILKIFTYIITYWRYKQLRELMLFSKYSHKQDVFSISKLPQ